ncbi:MAG TPA: S41 family peptidase [Bacteroidota bacterium]|nr:S41 family peptidase [Bacteroidota bacterium]
MKKIIAVGMSLWLIVFSAQAGEESIYLKINRGMDIFGKVYKEIATGYVDTIDPEKFMRAGIDGMLETLDPYTVFMDDKEGDEIELITHGEYGGVGITIGIREGSIIVLAPMDGYSAQKQGIRAGDRIMEINDEEISGTLANPDSVRSRVRGEPGTTVRVKVDREGVAKPLEFVLVREQIQVNNVTYSGYMKSGVGYIRLDRFSRRAGDEIKQAIREFQLRGNLHGIVLDLRDNPGGLLEAAVEVVSAFLPQGSTIVTTKGRRASEEKVYRVETEPIAPDVPLVVLVNKGSASASEIVAGALQDLDRAVIIGTRSFGKGLVQTVTPLTYNATLKLTTARYYTPSGRSIQEVDYVHKGKDGVFQNIPDSLKHNYATSHGRIVRDFGGIMPDSVVEEHVKSSYYDELMQSAAIFKYATHYVANHPSVREDFTIGDDIVSEFETYLTSQNYTYQDETEKKLVAMKEAMNREHYSDDAFAILDTFAKQIEREKKTVFARNKHEVKEEIDIELHARYFGEKGRITTALKYDKQAQTAGSILEARPVYDRILKNGRK